MSGANSSHSDGVPAISGSPKRFLVLGLIKTRFLKFVFLKVSSIMWTPKVRIASMSLTLNVRGKRNFMERSDATMS